MCKYGLRPNAWEISFPESIYTRESAVDKQDKHRINKLRETFFFFLTQWLYINKNFGSAAHRREIFNCNFPTDQASTLRLSIPFTWENRLSRAKPRNNQPGNPVEKTGVYMFSLFGDWMLTTGLRNCSVGQVHSRDITRKHSRCKYLW